MRYFITGTAGFIGFHLARRLLQDGHEVTGFDGMTPYYDVKLKEMRHAALAQFPAFRPVIAMLEDRKALEEAVLAARPDVLIHLAAQAGVRYSLEEPKSYVETNILGTWNLLEAARAVNPRHLMLASTSSVYGANESIPFRETDRAEVEKCLAAQGGLDACRLAFYSGEDIGEDKVWDNWRLEGPSFVWYFRGAPHVHVWVNVADSSEAKITTAG